MHRLQAVAVHIFYAQASIAILDRGIALSRNGMVNRFATFAVAGLSVDAADSMVSGRAHHCMSGRRPKEDKLEVAGYRWTGEKTLVTLYLNAIGCERRRSRGRHVADPIANGQQP